ncbi:MAG: pyruvate synthase subunit beta [Candidatus Heimdallarchaeota archaeon]|nr:pyruvate synthase subunit beta [Candidatus Heimdallarchaeota archaeon]
MTVTQKDLLNVPKKALLKGHFACAGCGSALAFRHAISAIADKVILVVPASCASVYQGGGKGASFNVPTINTAFAASDAVASGVRRAMKMKGKDDLKVVVWGGDGSGADIGIATEIGACDRQEDILHIIYSNNVYGNTGGQRSGDTMIGAKTATTPKGNTTPRKMVPFIMIANNARYVATASSAFIEDLVEKVKKAISFEGFKLIQIDAPCPPNWRTDSADSVKVARLAVQTGIWPLFEWDRETNEVVLSRASKKYEDKSNRKQITEWTSLQGRLKTITEDQLIALEFDTERQWNFLRKFM